MNVFEELIENTKKKNYDEYLKDEMFEEREQIVKGIRFEKQLDIKFRNKLESGKLPWRVKTVSDNLIDWANNELNNGKVAAVDGTNMVPLDLISGVFCQVGVGGLSYLHDNPSINVQSITSHINNDTNAGEYFGKLIFGKDKKISKFDIQAAMSYWEVEHCLQRSEKWVLKDGPLIPRELFMFDKGSDILNDVITNVSNPALQPNIIGVVKGSKSTKYRILGRFLRDGEYMIIESLSDFLKDSLKDIRFNSSFRGTRSSRRLIKNELKSVKRGVYRAKAKSYVFEIHEDIFDKGIALIMADSIRNPRGLPFLVDLIDSKLSALFENNIYTERMHSFLLEQGELMENINERELRNW